MKGVESPVLPWNSKFTRFGVSSSITPYRFPPEDPVSTSQTLKRRTRERVHSLAGGHFDRASLSPFWDWPRPAISLPSIWLILLTDPTFVSYG